MYIKLSFFTSFFMVLMLGFCKSNTNSQVSENIQCTDCEVFNYNDTDREYILYKPDSLAINAPLLFVLHGYGSSAMQFNDIFKIKNEADKKGFAVVFPQGLRDKFDKTHWNARLKVSKVDDIGFLTALAKELQAKHKLNADKTFVTGFSNGGFMTYTLLAEAPEVFKGGAVLMGTMSGTTWKKRNTIKPSPLLLLTGDLDDNIPAAGFPKDPMGWGSAAAPSKIIEFWGIVNATTTVNETKINPHTTARVLSGGTYEVWHYSIDNMGHEMPFGENNSINTAELVSAFLIK